MTTSFSRCLCLCILSVLTIVISGCLNDTNVPGDPDDTDVPGNTLYGYEIGMYYDVYYGKNLGVHTCGNADDVIYTNMFVLGYDDGYTQAYGGEDDPRQYARSYQICQIESGGDTCLCQIRGEVLDGYGDGYLAGSLDAPEDGEYPRSYKLRYGRTPKWMGYESRIDPDSFDYDSAYADGYLEGYARAYKGQNMDATISDLEAEASQLRMTLAWMAVNEPGADASQMVEEVNALQTEAEALRDGSDDGKLDMPVADSSDYNSVTVPVGGCLSLTITVSESLDTMTNIAKTVRILLNGKVIAEGMGTQSYIGTFSEGDVLTLQVEKPGKVAGHVRTTVTLECSDLWWGN